MMSIERKTQKHLYFDLITRQTHSLFERRKFSFQKVKKKQMQYCLYALS